jgi:5-methylcytosine-specific restriction endonuclease McrA
VERDVLAELVDRGLSTAQIAAELDRHPRIVAGWLREHGLQTDEAVRRRQNQVQPGTRRAGVCPQHGEVQYVARGDGSWRCVRCRSERVSEARRRRKAQLVAEAGGRCVICGYSRCVAALQFHHIDPASKRFAIAHRGAARSLSSMRDEAAKCVLLCSNCHTEVETGLTQMPIK